MSSYTNTEKHWTEGELLEWARRLLEGTGHQDQRKRFAFLDACRRYDARKAATAEQLSLWNRK